MSIKTDKIYDKTREFEHFCPICGRLVERYEAFQYVQTRRKSHLFIHDECLKKEGMKESDIRA